MKDQIISFMTHHVSLPVATIILATLPILEIRGALPVAVLGGMPLWLAYVVSVFGNMIPIPFIIWFLEPATNLVRRWPLGNRFVEWLFARTRRKGASIEKAEFWGLAIFVGIPLPMTGAWSGALAGHIFGLNRFKNLLACFVGVCMAGVVMALLSVFARETFLWISGTTAPAAVP